MDSKEQLEIDSKKEQPGGNGEDPSKKASDQTVNIDGQDISIDELKAGYMRQSDYTKKTQDLSKQKKDSELSDEDKAAMDFLKKNNFLTKEDLEKAISSQKNENNLTDIIQSNPDLKQFEAAIKKLSFDDGIAPEDVIEKYGFKSKDKLARAKNQGDVRGSSNPTGQKAIKDMSEKEYSEYKVKMGIGSKGSFI